MSAQGGYGGWDGGAGAEGGMSGMGSYGSYPTQGNMAPGPVAPGAMAPGAMAPGSVAPGSMAPSSTPKQVSQSSFASDGNGKIFVGGLPKNCSQEQLLAWASQFGQCSECEVKIDPMTGQPRGFGFVNFSDPAAAQKVVANRDNNMMEGKWIDCKPHTPGGGKAAGGKGSLSDPGNPKLFVGALPKTATEESVRLHFSQFGNLADVMVKMTPDGMCQGFGFITFEDPASAKAVTDNYDNNMFEGKWVDCKSAVKGGGKGGGGGKPDPWAMMSGMMGMMGAMMGGGKGGGKGWGKKGKGWGPYW